MDRLHSIFSLGQVSSNEDKHSINVELDANHEVFKGHFPDQPVLPGVVQLELVKYCLEQITGKSLTTNAIKSVKYLQVIDPRETTSMQVDITVKSNDDTGISIAATINNGDTGLMKLSASYR